LNTVNGEWVYYSSTATSFFEQERLIAACSTYNFTVTAANGYGESDYSDSYLVNNGEAPTKLTVVAASTNSDDPITGGFDISTSFSGAYDNGGCDTEGVGHWEYDVSNTTEPYCYSAMKAYDDAAIGASSTLPVVKSRGPYTYAHCNIDSTSHDSHAAKPFVAFATEYTIEMSKVGVDWTTAVTFSTPKYYIGFPTGLGSTGTAKGRDYTEYTFYVTASTEDQLA